MQVHITISLIPRESTRVAKQKKENRSGQPASGSGTLLLHFGPCCFGALRPETELKLLPVPDFGRERQLFSPSDWPPKRDS
jgi:hypothetical protein